MGELLLGMAPLAAGAGAVAGDAVLPGLLSGAAAGDAFMPAMLAGTGGSGMLGAMSPGLLKGFSDFGAGFGKATDVLGKANALGMMGQPQQPNVAPMQKPQAPPVESFAQILQKHGMGGSPAPTGPSSLAVQARLMGMTPEQLMRKLMQQQGA